MIKFTHIFLLIRAQTIMTDGKSLHPRFLNEERSYIVIEVKIFKVEDIIFKNLFY